MTILAALLSLVAAAPLASPLPLKKPLQDKNFYLLSLFENKRKELGANPKLHALGTAKREALRQAAAQCGNAAPCYMDKLKLSDAEIDTVEQELRDLAVRDTFFETELRKSGVRIREADQKGADLVAGTWRMEALAMNRLLNLYGLGEPPHYPEIDGPMYEAKSPAFQRLVQVSAAVLDDAMPETPLFYDVTLRFTLELMLANHRDEAGRFEPMERGENRAAFEQIRKTDFSAFPYSAIVVPGAGSDRITIPFSPAGRARVELAAKRYKEGKAPFILVSGGFVHPNQTPHCEAIEMKKSLIAEFGVPESAILIDPHARHTTTNLRNAARLLYRYGMPFTQKALITTDMMQSTYIEGQPFADRCRKEIGYLPHKLLGRTSRFDLEFMPLVESLEEDPSEPLDP